MPANESLVIVAGRGPARVRLDLGGGQLIYLDIRLTPNQDVELEVASPVHASLVPAEAPPVVEEALSPFDDPNFSQRLVEHMHRAKRKAITEAQEAGLHGHA
jgi:hypothetical protein